MYISSCMMQRNQQLGLQQNICSCLIIIKIRPQVSHKEAAQKYKHKLLLFQITLIKGLGQLCLHNKTPGLIALLKEGMEMIGSCDVLEIKLKKKKVHRIIMAQSSINNVFQSNRKKCSNMS